MARLKKFIIHNSIFIILLVAAFLRLWRIDAYMTFLGDEGRDVLVVKRMIVDHKWTLLGPTASVGGFFLGPIYYYFMLPFLWAFRLNPVGPAVMVALFGIATVYLVFRVGKEFFNEAAGLMAAALYSLSPLVIAYSRSSWNPNLVPFFSLLYIWSLYQAVKTSHWLWWFLSGVWIGIGLQLHYLFTFLIVAGTVFLWLVGQRLAKIKYWVGKLVGIIMGWSPYIAFELRHRFPNTRTLYNFIFHGEETGFAGFELGRLTEILFRLFSRLVFYFPPSEQYYLYDDQRWLFVGWRLLVNLAILVSLMVLFDQMMKNKKPEHLLLLCWLVFGVGLFLFYQKAVYDYYLGIMFPLPFLLVANAISSLAKKKILQPVAILCFLGLLALNWSGQPFQFPPNKQLAQAKTVANIVFNQAKGQPMNFALITHQNSDHAYRYFLEIWGNPPVVIENLANDPERKTVTDQLLVVCEVMDCKPLGYHTWEIAGFGRAEIVGQWEGPVGIKVMKLVHYQGE